METVNRLYRFTFVLILAVAVVAAFLFLVWTFVIDIVLAAIFAGLLNALLERWLPAMGGRRGATAGLIVLVAVVAVVVPIALLVSIVGPAAIQLGQQAIKFVQGTLAHPQTMLASLPPWLSRQSAVTTLTERAEDAAKGASQLLSGWALSATHGAVRLFLDLFVIAFALPYFLRNGPGLVARISDHIPLSRDEAQSIVNKSLTVTSSTLKGMVVVGAAQGVLIGSGFWVTGIGHPWFWGTIAAVASLVPGLGSGLVWAPGALYLVLTGHVVAGIGLAIWGLLAVLLGDNTLRALVVGRGASMPPFLVFISTLGGLVTIGPAGLLIGPVLAGLLIGVLDLYFAVLKSSGL